MSASSSTTKSFCLPFAAMAVSWFVGWSARGSVLLRPPIQHEGTRPMLMECENWQRNMLLADYHAALESGQRLKVIYCSSRVGARGTNFTVGRGETCLCCSTLAGVHVIMPAGTG